MDGNLFSANDYREWLIGNLHRFGHDEFIAMIVPMGDDRALKDVLDDYERGSEIYEHVEK